MDENDFSNNENNSRCPLNTTDMIDQVRNNDSVVINPTCIDAYMQNAINDAMIIYVLVCFFIVMFPYKY